MTNGRSRRRARALLRSLHRGPASSREVWRSPVGEGRARAYSLPRDGAPGKGHAVPVEIVDHLVESGALRKVGTGSLPPALGLWIIYEPAPVAVDFHRSSFRNLSKAARIALRLIRRYGPTVKADPENGTFAEGAKGRRKVEIDAVGELIALGILAADDADANMWTLTPEAAR